MEEMTKAVPIKTVEEFKELMYKMQYNRREIVKQLLEGQLPRDENIEHLRQTFNSLFEISQTKPLDSGDAVVYRLTIPATSSKNTGTYPNSTDMDIGEQLGTGSGKSNNFIKITVKDEVLGLQKDLTFLRKLLSEIKSSGNVTEQTPSSESMLKSICNVNLKSILAAYHPKSSEQFYQELVECIRFLKRLIATTKTQGKRPIFVTDWDGTMKDYCTQYATNLQDNSHTPDNTCMDMCPHSNKIKPIYSAISLANFAKQYTRLSAVLTAGPLRGPGILDLTSLPIDQSGPILFSGSWGREWWIEGKRRVHSDGISDEGINALDRLGEEVCDLLKTRDEFSHFGLVGSGYQRKIDRITLGIQTVDRDICQNLASKYQNEVKERIHRVDPTNRIFHFDSSQELEVEVVVQNDGVVWNKANGMKHVMETMGEKLDPPGYVLICGDTNSDVPMVEQALKHNPNGVMTCFVTTDPKLRERIKTIILDPDNRLFVSCPDVIHAAIMELMCSDLLKNSEIEAEASSDVDFQKNC